MFIGIFLIFSSELFANVIKVIVPSSVLKDYNKFIENKNPLSVKSFKSKYSKRGVVEIVLLQQALFYGKYSTKIKLIKAPTYARVLSSITDGSALITGNTNWIHDLKRLEDKLYISDALLLNGEFEAGLYTSFDNVKVLSSKTLEDIQKLTAISSKQWIPDWTTLIKLNLKDKQSVVRWSLMTRMVKAKRADFLLAPFQETYDLSFKAANTKFVPIPNLKVSLYGTRHFAISKKNKNAQAIFNAINKGIKILREKKIIHKAYVESGFFNEKVKDWIKLN